MQRQTDDVRIRKSKNSPIAHLYRTAIPQFCRRADPPPAATSPACCAAKTSLLVVIGQISILHDTQAALE